METLASICEKCAKESKGVKCNGLSGSKLVEVALRERIDTERIAYSFDSEDDAISYLEQIKKNSNYKNCVASISTNELITPDPEYIPQPRKENKLTNNINYAQYYLNVAKNSEVVRELVKYVKNRDAKRYGDMILSEEDLVLVMHASVKSRRMPINTYLPKVVIEVNDGRAAIGVYHNELISALYTALQTNDVMLVELMLKEGFDIFQRKVVRTTNIIDDRGGFTARWSDKPTIAHEAFSESNTIMIEVARFMKKNDKAGHERLLRCFAEILSEESRDGKFNLKFFLTFHEVGQDLAIHDQRIKRAFIKTILKDTEFDDLSADLQARGMSLLISFVPKDLDEEKLVNLVSKLGERISKCEDPNVISSFLERVNDLGLGDKFKFNSTQAARLQKRFTDKNGKIKEAFINTFEGQETANYFYVQLSKAIDTSKTGQNASSAAVYSPPGNDSGIRISKVTFFDSAPQRNAHTKLQTELFKILESICLKNPESERSRGEKNAENKTRAFFEALKPEATQEDVINGLINLSQENDIKGDNAQFLFVEAIVNEVANMPLTGTNQP